MSQPKAKPSNVIAHPASSSPVEYTEDQIELLKRTICIGANDDEFSLFMGICRRTGLDPFARQICMTMRYNSKLERNVPCIQITVDGFRLIASRTGQYGGQKPHQWCGPDGVWKDVWLEDHHPSAARVGVMREGFSEPLYAVARWDSYAQHYFKRDSKSWELTHPWKSMGEIMISKCAECLSLRRAFPNDLSGLYTLEETQGEGMALDGKLDVTHDAQSSQSSQTDAPPALITAESNPLAVMEAQIEPAVKDRISQLVQRAVKNNSFDIASEWAAKNLSGITLQYFGNKLLEARQETESSN